MYLPVQRKLFDTPQNLNFHWVQIVIHKNNCKELWQSAKMTKQCLYALYNRKDKKEKNKYKLFLFLIHVINREDN